MDALIASYGDSDSDSDSESLSESTPQPAVPPQNPLAPPLPPPPVSLLVPPNSLLGTVDTLQPIQPNRVRSFPHVDGNYALHVYIPGFFLLFASNFCSCQWVYLHFHHFVLDWVG
ncbi:unnamed protein product [Amaranthus hypochondriacus]